MTKYQVFELSFFWSSNHHYFSALLGFHYLLIRSIFSNTPLVVFIRNWQLKYLLTLSWKIVPGRTLNLFCSCIWCIVKSHRFFAYLTASSGFWIDSFLEVRNAITFLLFNLPAGFVIFIPLTFTSTTITTTTIISVL